VFPRLSGLPKPVAKELDRLLAHVLGNGNDTRELSTKPLPRAGTILVREWQGTAHYVTVTDEGFLWNGKPHRSLSGVARAITGTKWNGPRFFGLRDVNNTMASASRTASFAIFCAALRVSALGEEVAGIRSRSSIWRARDGSPKRHAHVLAHERDRFAIPSGRPPSNPLHPLLHQGDGCTLVDASCHKS
jgi:hypothetical protein